MHDGIKKMPAVTANEHLIAERLSILFFLYEKHNH
jgi:hypothetical protein